LLQALNAKMEQVHDNYQKEKLAKEQFDADLERIKKEATSSGSGKHRKTGASGPHMMDTDVLDQHMFQSPEYVGELERVSYGGGKR
jgi:COP9 signalosome complex subunit 7